MTFMILRRPKLGRGSSRGILASMKTAGAVAVRHWRAKDWKLVNQAPIVVRWGCTAAMPEGVVPQLVLNKSEAIHWASNKKESRIALQDAGVPVPKTYSVVFNKLQGDELPDPNKQYVARFDRHAQGRNIKKGNFAECLQYVMTRGNGYISEYIDKVAEYRVFVAQNRAVWVAKKTPGNPDAVAWNVAQGGRFDNVGWKEWPIAVVKAALAAMKASPLDFGGVDVMVDKDGKAYVLEINSAPSQTSPYRQSCVAKVFDYIADNKSKAPFDDVALLREDGKPRKLTGLSFVHPAVKGEPANAAA